MQMPGKHPWRKELNQWEIIFQVVSKNKMEEKLKTCPKQTNQLRFLMDRVTHGSEAVFFRTTEASFPLGTRAEPVL